MPRVFGVFILDDDAVVRHALHELVDCDPELKVVGEAASVNDALARIPPCRPDVVLLDDRLPDGNGFDLCRDVCSRMPGLQCVIFTSFGSTNELLNAIQAGASGCIVRNAKGSEVLAAIKGVAAGEFLFDTGVATRWLANWARKVFLDAVAVLTEQEGELLRLLLTGHTNSQIASRMRFDERAFRACIRALIAKALAPPR
jgi:two-component system, NarL family, response regulator DevR